MTESLLLLWFVQNSMQYFLVVFLQLFLLAFHESLDDTTTQYTNMATALKNSGFISLERSDVNDYIGKDMCIWTKWIIGIFLFSYLFLISYFPLVNNIQTRGTAIDTKMAPTYATLTLAYLEENIYKILGKKNTTK